MPKAYSYIRFSRLEQAAGDSLRRQTALSETYAKEHELVLDKSLKADLGVSAFRGKNIDSDSGSLGRFLQLVEDGRVERGSVLLVENLDRLSREEVPKALRQFLGIMDSGLKIVILGSPPIEFEEEKLDTFRLMWAIMEMSRGHGESQHKSTRVGAAWKQKKLNAALAPLTARVPAWMKLREDRKGFDLIKHRVDIVEEIFNRTEAGEGKARLAKELNSKEPSWGPRRKKGTGGGWHPSYIQKILCNRSVLGEYAPHKITSRGRVPDGEPIPRYYPAVITEAQFDRVAAVRKQRSKFAGRVGTGVTNLFTGLLHCISTKGGVRYRDHGSPAWRYLRSDRAMRGFGKKIELKGWQYAAFESLFLTHVRQLDWALIFGGPAKKRSLGLRELVAEFERRDAELVKKIERGTAAILDSDSPMPNMKATLAKLEKERADLVTQLLKSKAELDAVDRQLNSLSGDKSELTKLLGGDITGRETRLKIRQELRAFVQRIDVYFGEAKGVRSAARVRFSEVYFIVRYTNGEAQLVRPGGKTGTEATVVDLKYTPQGAEIVGPLSTYQKLEELGLLDADEMEDGGDEKEQPDAVVGVAKKGSKRRGKKTDNKEKGAG